MKKRQRLSSQEQFGRIPNEKTAVVLNGCQKCFEKKIHEAIQEDTGPRSLEQRNTAAFEKLSEEQLDELRKQMDLSFGT